MHPDDDADPLLARRRRLKRTAARRRLYALLGVLALLAVGGVVALGVAASRRGAGEQAQGGGGVTRPLFGGPSAAGEGETWDHRELAEYLRSRGLAVHSEPTEIGTLFGPACLFRPASDDRTQEVYVQKRATAQAAKDEAGATRQPAFSWGRFLFYGGEPASRYAAQIRSALLGVH